MIGRIPSVEFIAQRRGDDGADKEDGGGLGGLLQHITKRASDLGKI